MQSILIQVTVWSLLWGSGWLGFFSLKRFGVDYIRRWPLTIIYFLSVSLLVAWAFKEDLARYLHAGSLLLPSIVALFSLIAGIASIRRLKKPAHHGRMFFMSFDQRYIASKSFEIAFQQVMIVLLASWLDDSGLSLGYIMLLFAVIFGLAHLYLLKSMGKVWGAIFILSSVLSGMIFPFIIIRVPWGFVYSYLLHWGFYIVLGALWKESWRVPR